MVLTKVFVHPVGPGSAAEFYRRLAVGDLFPSWFVVATAGVFVALVTLLAVMTPSEEALDDWSKIEHARFLEQVNRATSVTHAPDIHADNP